MKKYCIYIRVSTGKQGRSGLGLESQEATCKDFIRTLGGEYSRTFKDVESGKSRTREGLWSAIDYCKKNDEGLVIAKLDRLARDVEFTFKIINTGIDIHFADMPVVNTIILGVFASVGQYERELISKRTKAALDAKKARGEATGGTRELWGKNTGGDRSKSTLKAGIASGEARKERAKANPENRAFFEFIMDWEDLHGKIDWRKDGDLISSRLNSRGRRTATGMEYTPKRAKAMYDKVIKLYA